MRRSHLVGWAVLMAGFALFFLATAIVAWHSGRGPFTCILAYAVSMLAAAWLAGASLGEDP